MKSKKPIFYMSKIPSLSLICFIANCLNNSLLADVSQANETSCKSDIKPYRVSVRHIEKGGIGYYQGYSTLEGFFSLNPQKLSTTPFLDIRGHIFNNGRLAANVGCGLRSLVGKRTYGFNAYYDYRNTDRLNYNQAGFGLETLGTLLDFRINGYLPFGKRTTSPYNIRFNNFSGHNAYLYQKRQFAMKGASADVGFHFGKSKNFDYYATIGPYYFIGQVASNIWGGKARISVSYKDYIKLELSDSYDRMFKNRFQGQLTLNLPFGKKAVSKKSKGSDSCKTNNALISRMIQPVYREEIIVVGKTHQNPRAIDPATGKPYYFVFVDNTSSSNGTYESPYHSLIQAQDNSSINDIIYLFPGDGTTKGMDSGITLKDYQKLWGSSLNYQLLTSQGLIAIPSLSSQLPTITNINVDTLGNAITLAANNTIQGINVNSPLSDAIFGEAIQNLDVSNCAFENTTRFVLEGVSQSTASIIFNNNTLINNTNGVNVTFNGPSSFIAKNNLFQGQTSVSNAPIEIIANNNTVEALIEKNTFLNNTTSATHFIVTDVNQLTINFTNNILTNNNSGTQASIGSSFLVLPYGTSKDCKITFSDNTLSSNYANAFYLYSPGGTFNNLDITASRNTISNQNGGGFVIATPASTLSFVANNNTLTGFADNAIAVIAPGSGSKGTVIINNNTITNVANSSSGIAINQSFASLDLSMQNNFIDSCEGNGFTSYQNTPINFVNFNVTGNTITNCLNNQSNLASGFYFDQFTNLRGNFANNTLLDNAGPNLFIGSVLPDPNVCFSLTGNTSNYFFFNNPLGGVFNLSPTNAASLNTGTFVNYNQPIDYVDACPVTYSKNP